MFAQTELLCSEDSSKIGSKINWNYKLDKKPNLT